MKQYTINYSINGYSDLSVKIMLSDKVKIPDETINKVLIVAIHHLMDNMETTEQESAE